MLGRPALAFPFAGLTTAVRQAAGQAGIRGGGCGAQVRSDLAASFQAAVGDTLADRCAKALMVFQEDYGAAGPLVVAGGVAANRGLRRRLETRSEEHTSELQSLMRISSAVFCLKKKTR